MRTLFLDCFSGISGDMTVGALCDLGVKPSALEWELSKLELGEWHTHFQKEMRQAIQGVKFSIHENQAHGCSPESHHGHEGHQVHPPHHAVPPQEEHSHPHWEEKQSGEEHGHAHEHCSCGHHHHEEHEHHHSGGRSSGSDAGLAVDAGGQADCNAEAHPHSHSHSHCSHEHHSHQEHEAHSHCSCGGHHEHEHGHSLFHSQSHSHSHAEAHGHSHEHEHGHGHSHPHGRTHAQIKELISNSSLSDFVKTHALSMFQRIAVAEGKVHGVSPDHVAFHEVGALDSIADIVMVCAGLEMLGVEKVYVSNLHDGSGWIDCAHGRFPIPSAATLEILKGIPVRQIEEPFEFITPTGAAIVAEFGVSFGPMPQMKVEKIGYGVGTRKLPSRPNVLRAVLGEIEPEAAASYQTDQITRLETNLDDLSPELIGAAMEKLLKAGALDVFFTPIQMKKNRPAIQLSVLCEESDASKLADIIFSETTAFGLRMEQISRLKLARKFEKVKTAYGEITVKIGMRGDQIMQIVPEFESCRAASESTGAPLKLVYEAAQKAAKEA